MITPGQVNEAGLSCETLVANLRALYAVDLPLAQQLDDLPNDPTLTISAAKSGCATASVTLADGRPLSLHSRYDPVVEAAKFVDGIHLDSNYVFFVSGLGLGYVARQLFDRADSIVVVVLEPCAALIRAALANIDFTKEIRSRRLILLDRLDKGKLHTKLNEHTATMTLGVALAALPYTSQWHRELQSEFHTAIADFSAYCRMIFVTLIANSRRTQENVANNLWAYHCCPTIDVLKNRFAGRPAIVVSAGPSLQKNVHLLKRAKGHAVIIAVQTTLKTLQKLGIEPDFVTSLDYHDISRRFFEGIDDFGRIHLVAEPKVARTVPDTFTGKTPLSATTHPTPSARPIHGHLSFTQNEFADACLGTAARKRASMTAGSTVAHLAFYLAEFIGADPIILIGQDLAFGGNMYYSPGNAVHDVWSVELNRFSTLEMKEWERVVRNRPILRTVEDISGRRIFTDEQMFTYLEQFERDFATTKARVIDATEGGARKSNTQLMTLADALDVYAGEPLDPTLFVYHEELTWFQPEKLIEVATQLDQRCEEIDRFQTLCRETAELLHQLEGLFDQPDKFNKLIVKVDAIRSRVNRHARTLAMVCTVSANADLRRVRSDRVIEAAKLEGKDVERAKRQLARDRDYVESVRDGCDELRHLLRASRARVCELMREHGIDDPTPTPQGDSQDDSATLFSSDDCEGESA
jgi:hypothetical protein